jgi:hypothetical protein
MSETRVLTNAATGIGQGERILSPTRSEPIEFFMVQAATEYLVSFGRSGEFGRFSSVEPLTCRRGDSLIVETSRGLEFGQVIRQSAPEHARLMGGSAGRIVRRPGPADLETRDQLKARGQNLFHDARSHASRLNLPLEIVDAEILLDGKQAVLHVLRWGEGDFKQLTDSLIHSHGVMPLLHDLALPANEKEPEPAHTDDHGCGSGGCGSGGCGSGGCSTGGCGSCSSGGCSTTPHEHTHGAERPQAISLL